jgi:hypothetical protein
VAAELSRHAFMRYVLWGYVREMVKKKHKMAGGSKKC